MSGIYKTHHPEGLTRWHDEEAEVFCKGRSNQTPETTQPGQWELLNDALTKWAGYVSNLAELNARVDALERQLSDGSNRSIIVPIQTVEPEPFDLIREIKVVVRPSDEEFVASFFDANVNASGCTFADAVSNLKAMLLRRFDYLDKMPIAKLGPALIKQIAVLRTIIRRRSANGGNQRGISEKDHKEA
jgi:hypothetical protein